MITSNLSPKIQIDMNEIKNNMALESSIQGVNSNIQNLQTNSNNIKNNMALESTVQEIKTIVSNLGGSNDTIEAAAVDTVRLALLSEDTLQNEWAFRQANIGAIINDAFELNSSDLANCNTVAEIASSTSALSAIKTSGMAIAVCYKDKTLGPLVADNYAEAVLSTGMGYAIFNVGDIVNITFNGVKTPFRVVAKNYHLLNKITLMTENCITTGTWHNSSTNNYSSSRLRTYLNGSSVLGKFSTTIQNAIQAVPVSCHNYTTAVTCTDKIWAPSFTEMNLGTNSSAPVEGTALEYFNDANKRIKYYNNAAQIYWLRTPFTDNTSNAWLVGTRGGSYNNSVTDSYGVVFALVI